MALSSVIMIKNDLIDEIMLPVVIVIEVELVYLKNSILWITMFQESSYLRYISSADPGY